MSTFAGMALLADFCSAQVLHVFDLWSGSDEVDDNYREEYLAVIHGVLKAADKFDVLDDNPRRGQANDLDRLFCEADIVDLTEASSMGIELCPVQELRTLQQDCYHSLQKIFGFLFDLATPSMQKSVKEKSCVRFEPGRQGGLVFEYLAGPPATFQWRTKAKAILEECEEWYSKSGPVISNCKDWYSKNRSLSQRADQALKRSEKLKRQAKPCLYRVPRNIVDPVTDRFVCLKLSCLRDLPRGNKLFRAQGQRFCLTGFTKLLTDNMQLPM